MGLTKRISIVDKAVLTATGNSMIICGSNEAVFINTSDMITLDGNTTRDYTKAGSRAILDMLADSTVLYAELIWYSTVASTFPGAVDVRAVQDNPITLETPNGKVHYITPNNTDDFMTILTGEAVRFRSADVTEIIEESMSGTYSVSNVPTSIPPEGLNNTRCGWSLNVIYRNRELPPKKIDFLSGIAYSTDVIPYQTTIAGFTTPESKENLKGKLFITASNAAILTGDETVKIGPTLANLTVLGNKVGSPNPNPLTAPNNPYNNFFAGQINICDPLSPNMGLIDIKGTNGTNNNDAFIPAQIVGTRNKWDMTAIDISNVLVPNQTQLAFELDSKGYSVQLMSIGTQIDAVAPDVIANFDINDVDVGEKSSYSITIENKGQIAADNVVVSLDTGEYVDIQPGTLCVNNVPVSGDINKGINVGSIGPFGLSKIKFEVSANALPPIDIETGKHVVVSRAEFSYQFVSGISTITNGGVSNTKSLIVQKGDIAIKKSISNLKPTIGDTVVFTNTITNTGSQALENIVFQDMDSRNRSFVEDSVYVNDVLTAGVNPNEGISLDNLQEGDTVTVKYSVKINSSLSSGKEETSSSVKFAYKYDNIEKYIYKTAYSNTVFFIVQFSKIIKKICASNNYPSIGDKVTYSTNLRNVGNIAEANVLMKDKEITGCTFVEGSVTVNDVKIENVNPYVGFILNDAIEPLATTYVKYDVILNSRPDKDSIKNTAEIPFDYIINQEQGNISDKKSSNVVEALSNFVCLSMIEEVSSACSRMNDSIYYKVTITNTGNIGASNVMFTSNIQSDVTFVPDSVRINGISHPSYDPVLGFRLDDICEGNSTEIIFEVKVTTIPDSNIIYNQSSLKYSYLPNPNGEVMNSTITSNRVETILRNASYTATITLDKEYALTGESLVYKAILNNTGNTELYDVSFYDNLPSYLQFESGTVHVNGINYPELNPVEGFNLETLRVGDSARILFSVKVVSSPIAGYVINSADFTFAYQGCIDSPTDKITLTTNEVKVNIVEGDLTINKKTNKFYAVLGDAITYSFDVSNTGNVPLINVLFEDNINPSLQFVTGSVIVNNISKPEYSPADGFSLGSINVGQIITISFDVIVIDDPSPNVVTNYATGIYEFLTDPVNQPTTETKNSNTVQITINKSDVNLTKNVDMEYATIDDVLTYTTVAENNGTVPITNVNIRDAVPDGAEFIEDSVIVNGQEKLGYNPNTGFKLDDSSPNSNSTIIYKAKVVEVPFDNKILNTDNMSYEYKLTPTGNNISADISSNTVVTNVNTVSISNVKSVDKLFATRSDTLVYTSIITNLGTVQVNNATFIDEIPLNTTFNAGSVTINDVQYADYNPQTGFDLGSIEPEKSVKVQFTVNIVETPTTEVVNNQSNIIYQYKLYQNSTEDSEGNSLSNVVTTNIKIGSASITKTVDREYTRVDDILTYKIAISNTGNTILQNVLFKDVIESTTTFIENSVYVNDVIMEGLNPSIGFNLSDIGIGKNTTVSFKVSVNSTALTSGDICNAANVSYSFYIDPNENIKTMTDTSNESTVKVFDTIIEATKEVDKSIAKISDILNFTVNLTNIGSVTVDNIQFIDTLDINLEFVPQSVYINDVQYADYNPNTGFAIPNIAGRNSASIKFAAKIIDRPKENTIYNSAEVTYSYILSRVTYNDKMITNITSTDIEYGELTIIKSANKKYATLDDIIDYTVIVKNTGSVVTATGLMFKDIIQQEASFNIRSVKINGISFEDYDPNTGFALDDLLPNESHIVKYSTRVASLPKNNEIKNTAQTEFSYTLSGEEPAYDIAVSNSVIITVNLGKIEVIKRADMSYGTIGDTITYTTEITNVGNIICNNMIFSDVVQGDAKFVEDSVTVDNKIRKGFNPNNRFNLPSLKPGETVQVAFKVIVKSLPTNNILKNTASVHYHYIMNPGSGPINASATSNEVQTTVNVGSISAVKSVDKDYATIGDTLTYTTDILNLGNIDALAVNFRDVLSSGLTFVEGSVSIGGVSYPNYDPYNSFAIGKLIPGQTVKVVFKAEVTSMPIQSTINNVANIIFSYYIDPNGEKKTVESDSNSAITVINVGSISLTKEVDKVFVAANEILTYKFVLSNTGNVDLANVIFTDNLQTDIAFNSESVVINGVPEPTLDPTVGFSLGNVATLTNIEISFTVKVKYDAKNSSIINSAYATFTYKVNPNGESYTKTKLSNEVFTRVIIPSISAAKAVDLLFATVGDILNYTITVRNTGNYLVSSVKFIDTLSGGGTFIKGSVLVDGASFPDYNPISGFNLPDISVGNNVKVQFKALVESAGMHPVIDNYAVVDAKCVILETGNSVDVTTISNTTTTNVNVGELESVKSVNKKYARVSDVLTYTNLLANTGNVTVSDAFFKDVLQAELSFVKGTVKINDVLYSDLDPNVGFDLGQLEMADIVTVSFDAEIKSLSSSSIIQNSSITTFKYKLDPDGGELNGSITSNTVTTNVVNADITAAKYVDKSIATIGDEITYKVVLTNVGNIPVSNVMFTDEIALGAKFKIGSVKVNDISESSYNPSEGFIIPSILVGSIVNVEFKVIVESIPQGGNIANTAKVSYEYIVNPEENPSTAAVTSNTVTTTISVGSLEVIKSVDKTYVTIGDRLNYTVTIRNIGNIESNNVKFLDSISQNTVFVEGSVVVNGESHPSYNPKTGFMLGVIAPGQIVTVNYQVQVVNICDKNS